MLKVITVIRPETLVRWHRAGFRRYWRWRSRSFGGRPQIDTELRALIRQMSIENPLWGAPRIHGELLKLGFEVAQSSVAKYMVKRRGPPSQGWRTFLRNHVPEIAAMDLFVVPTIGFDLLYAFIIIRLDRRDLVWINVTTNPTAEWIARQITEAFPWNEAPHYLIRDRDRIYGTIVTRRLRAMGIRDKPIAPASPWQNSFAALDPNTPQTQGMERKAAINFARVGAQKIWAGTVSIQPNAKTGAHHHGELESVIYVVRGKARMRWGDHLEFVAEAGPGDFIYVPPFVPHQEINASQNESLECVLVRSDNEAVVVNLDIEPIEKPEQVAWIDPIHKG